VVSIILGVGHCCLPGLDAAYYQPFIRGRLIHDELLYSGVSQRALALQMLYPHPQLRPKPLSRALPQPSHRRLGEHREVWFLWTRPVGFKSPPAHRSEQKRQRGTIWSQCVNLLAEWPLSHSIPLVIGTAPDSPPGAMTPTSAPGPPTGRLFSLWP
jgi:hypothetical protein